MIEKLQLSSFEMISLIGLARKSYAQAVEEAKENRIINAKLLIEEGNNQLNSAHNVHFEFIQAEAKGEHLPYSMLFMHAEDQLLSVSTYRDMIEHIIQLYDFIYKGEKQ